jgi:hypothetical protein
MRWFPLCLAALLAPLTARADWAYTKWGMTPQEVVAASDACNKKLPYSP